MTYVGTCSHCYRKLADKGNCECGVSQEACQFPKIGQP